jgi:hypothetical protein
MAHRAILLCCGIWSPSEHSGLWQAVRPTDLWVHGLDRGGPCQLVVRDKWPSVVPDPLERSRIITEAMRRGERV